MPSINDYKALIAKREAAEAASRKMLGALEMVKAIPMVAGALAVTGTGLEVVQAAIEAARVAGIEPEAGQ